ncbi:hypothetical protein ACWEFL_15690 [Streptomyces sp. NPDC004838]
MSLLLWLGGGAAAVLAITALAWPVLRWIYRMAVRGGQIIDDWHGEPARPGVPARAGVMERLGSIETRVTAVEHEVRPNDGRSMRDAVDRVDVTLTGGPPTSP